VLVLVLSALLDIGKIPSDTMDRLVMLYVVALLKGFIDTYPRRYADPSFLRDAGQYSGWSTCWIESFLL
jgi:hypothetical protein